MEHAIRAIRADEWEKARDLRLAALQDPVAHLAFLETYEQAADRSDDFWRERASSAAEGVRVKQFIAEAADGRWDGTVTVLVERPGEEARFGEQATVEQTHLVAVFVRPDARGHGLADELFRAAVDWSWSLDDPRIKRVRLYVHEDNVRAEAFYRRIGFVPSGGKSPVPGDDTAMEVEYELPRGGGLSSR
ncbi:GNAT family N-acetyltransferase [Streptomyces sp. SCSIO 30461]|uniref:GNAT family N-acetyltransferase n=1 Tax=Streptomyces sp. SCSIO 30461 TaxID=3118085 RepID=UPI0030D3CDB0